MVLPTMSIPVLAVMVPVPAFEMLPVKVVTNSTAMAEPPTEMAPLLAMPPLEKLAMCKAAMPAKWPEMVPLLLRPPENVATFSTFTPDPAAAIIVPELRMPPVKFVTPKIWTPTPVVAAIAPALVIPPVNVGPVTLMASELAAVILLVASTVMPWVEPNRLPLSMIAPAIVLAAMTMALGAEMAPALAMLPVNTLTPST